MPDSDNDAYLFRCRCGQVEIRATGKPMSTIVCYCDDCQTGARYAEGLADAPRVLDEHGGTSVALFRKDRVTYVKGKELLRPHKNRETTATNRNIASCCNTLMCADFDNWLPWISLYEHAAVDKYPAREMRIFTKFSPAPENIPDNLPRYRKFPLSFPVKVLMTTAAVRLGL